MQNKVLPGAYINFVALSNVITSGSPGDRRPASGTELGRRGEDHQHGCG